MGRCRKIPTFGPSKPHRQLLNSDTHVSGRTNGFGLFFCVSTGHLLRRNRPVRYSAEEGHSERKLAGIGFGRLPEPVISARYKEGCVGRSPGAEHVGNLERFGLRVDNIDRHRNLPFFSRRAERRCRTVMSSDQVKLLAAARIQSTDVCFGVGRRSGPIAAEVRLAEVCLTKEL